MSANIPVAVPAVSCVAFDTDGTPRLVGSRCAACGCVTPGTRTICAACSARDRTETIRLAERGRLHSFTIVHRSFPGVPTPFIAAIVELEGGGALKGTLVDVEPRWDAVAFDMPVRVVFRDTGQKNADGGTFVSYYFAPSDDCP